MGEIDAPRVVVRLDVREPEDRSVPTLRAERDVVGDAAARLLVLGLLRAELLGRTTK